MDLRPRRVAARLPRLEAALRRRGADRRDLRVWATELWWESDPPDPSGVSLGRQAKWIEEGLYLLWKQGARVVLVIGIRDDPYDGVPGRSTLQSGLYFNDGQPKPALTAFSFPFVTERRSTRSVRVWGIAPVSGALVIERQRGDGWQDVKSFNVSGRSVFTTGLRFAGAERLRARIGDSVSLTWRQKG